LRLLTPDLPLGRLTFSGHHGEYFLAIPGQLRFAHAADGGELVR
jgi:hypothetical protein